MELVDADYDAVAHIRIAALAEFVIRVVSESLHKLDSIVIGIEGQVDSGADEKLWVVARLLCVS